MKILIYSPFFYPRLGGIEVKAMGLAEKLAGLGNEVVVVTNTPNTEPDSFPYRVLRQPRPLQYLKAVRWCNVYMQMNVSLRGLYPFLLFRRKFFVSHESIFCRPDGSKTLNGWMKYFVSWLAVNNICNSNYLSAFIPGKKIVVGSPYREDVFYAKLPYYSRTGDLVFLGRLVSDKGCDVLIKALDVLHKRGTKLKLSVIGDGPEKLKLEQLADDLGLKDYVTFYGTSTGPKLNALLNNHKIMVVPTLWIEAFGIVALEGLACGCNLIVSEEGGLKEAAGKTAHTFPSGNVEALVNKILFVAQQPVNNARGSVNNHLQQYTLDSISKKYQEILNN